MSCSKDVLKRLAEPFLPEEIEWKVQSASNGQNGISLLVVPYLDARVVMDRLDQVCGPLWQSEFEKILVNNKEAFQCKLSIKIEDEWIARTDAAEISDYESVKGGHSNSLKRAGVQWGIGRLLYDLPKFWVELKDRGDNRVYGKFKISGKQQQVQGYFDSPTLPDWALPSDYQGKGKSQQGNNKNQNNQQNHQGKTTNQQNYQQKKTTQQKPSKQQDQQPKKSPTANSEERQKQAVHHVKGLLQSLNVPIKWVPDLLKRASGSIAPLEEATAEDLEKLFSVLRPVNDYVSNCRQLGLGEAGMLYYCQITLKVELESIHSLYFKMTSEICNQTFKLVRGDLSKRAV